jgi:H+/Cl- antiporter ClcA
MGMIYLISMALHILLFLYLFETADNLNPNANYLSIIIIGIFYGCFTTFIYQLLFRFFLGV